MNTIIGTLLLILANGEEEIYHKGFVSMEACIEDAAYMQDKLIQYDHIMVVATYCEPVGEDV